MEICGILFFYFSQPAHPGSGGSVGAIDQPIQRERITHYPMIQSSSVKGALKSAVRARELLAESADELFWLFGPDPSGGDDGSGGGNAASDENSRSAISITDARLLLFPVASAKGVFGWTTSQLALSRLHRDLAEAHHATQATLEKLKPAATSQDDDPAAPVAGGSVDNAGAEPRPILPALDQLRQFILTPSDGTKLDAALWPTTPDLTLNERLYLEERVFARAADDDKDILTARQADLGTLTTFLGQHALPKDASYFRQMLGSQTALLPDGAFRDFVQYATQIETHVALDWETKRVKAGPWDVELLPAETLMYSLVSWKPAAWLGKDAQEAEKLFSDKVKDKLLQLQIGGLETLGRGIAAIHYHPVTDLVAWSGGTV